METSKLAADLYFPALSSLQYHQKAFVQWLPGQEFLPTDAFDEISFVEQELIYLPFYRVTGHFEATFSCKSARTGKKPIAKPNTIPKPMSRAR